ncbi:heavy metal-associated isoprenylated plant protein 13 [Capsella rubella]|nr:heavy metal-associated isoprenylated plant protein 13 [Capsella rubella]
MSTMKTVLQLSVLEERIRKKAFVTVSRCQGVASIAFDKTGKMTVVGEIDAPVIVMKLRKLCNTEIVSVEVVKPPEKKPEEKKPEAKPAAPAKPEIVAWPVQMSNPYQYHPAYANCYYQPYETSRVVVDEPGCVIM